MSILDKKISLFNSATRTESSHEVRLGEYFDWIRLTSVSDTIREFREETDPRKRRRLKAKMYCVTPSGLFHNRTDKELYSEHTGVLVFDLDAKDNPGIDIDRKQKQIGRSEFVLCVHKSVSGEGLAIYVRFGEGLSHNDYNSIRADLEFVFDIKLDAKTSNLSRLRFVSADENIIVNEDATEYTASYAGSIVKKKRRRYQMF